MTSTISLNHTKITSLRTIWISTSVLLCKKSLIVYISVYLYAKCLLGIFHGGSGGKEIACNAGDPDLIPGSRRSPEEGNGYPVQYSGLENSMDRGAWQATVQVVAKSWIGPSDFCHHLMLWGRGTISAQFHITRCFRWGVSDGPLSSSAPGDWWFSRLPPW